MIMFKIKKKVPNTSNVANEFYSLFVVLARVFDHRQKKGCCFRKDFASLDRATVTPPNPQAVKFPPKIQNSIKFKT